MLLLLAALSRALLRPLPEVISGVWNVTEVLVTADGLPSPDTAAFSIDIRATSESAFSGAVRPTAAALSVALGPNESFAFSLGDRFRADGAFETSAGGTRYAHGVAGGATFSLVLLSSWRAELTVVDRATRAVTLYRGVKGSTKSLAKRFSEGLVFFVQNLGLRIL
jgi:hypothetical protein